MRTAILGTKPGGRLDLSASPTFSSADEGMLAVQIGGELVGLRSNDPAVLALLRGSAGTHCRRWRSGDAEVVAPRGSRPAAYRRLVLPRSRRRPRVPQRVAVGEFCCDARSISEWFLPAPEGTIRLERVVARWEEGRSGSGRRCLPRDARSRWPAPRKDRLAGGRRTGSAHRRRRRHGGGEPTVDPTGPRRRRGNGHGLPSRTRRGRAPGPLRDHVCDRRRRRALPSQTRVAIAAARRPPAARHLGRHADTTCRGGVAVLPPRDARQRHSVGLQHRR